MDKDTEEVSRGKGRRIQRRAMRGTRRKQAAHTPFTKARRKAFLDHFAASCNAMAAGRAVKVSMDCVYRWRKKDAQFREAWQEALDQGYARLEAELVRAATAAVQIRASEAAAVRVGAVDGRTALAVLQAYKRSLGRNPGEVRPHPYDVEGVRRRLEAKMRLLGVLGADDEAEPDRPLPGSALPSRPSAEGERE